MAKVGAAAPYLPDQDPDDLLSHRAELGESTQLRGSSLFVATVKIPGHRRTMPLALYTEVYDNSVLPVARTGRISRQARHLPTVEELEEGD